MYEPKSNLRLLNVPFQSDYASTIWYPDRETQATDMLGRQLYAIDDFNYIKKDNVLCVKGDVDKYWKVNYIMYQNPEYSGKWFYAFVTNVAWASANSTYLQCQTDVIQTWLQDVTFYQSFIVRQHSTTDVVGDNIVPEPISNANGEVYQVVKAINIRPTHLIGFATCSSQGTAVGGGMRQGLYSGASDTIVEELPGDAEYISSTLKTYVDNGVATGVIKLSHIYNPETEGTSRIELDKHPSNILGYVPKNNKMLSGAFVSIFMNAMGQEVTANPEVVNTTGSTYHVGLYSEDTSGSLLINMEDYGMQTWETWNPNDDPPTSMLSISISYPEACWAYNEYKNNYNLHSESNGKKVKRLGQNQRANTVTSGLGTIGDIIGGAIGAVTGVGSMSEGKSSAGGASKGFGAISSIISALSGGTSGLTSTMQNVNGIDEISQELAAIDESYNAPATGGMTINNGYIAGNIAYLKLGFKVPPLPLVKQFDNYLTMYGYAVSEYGTPNFHARKSFTYIQTKQTMFDAPCPDNDATVLKAVLERGIHFWAYTATFGDFTQDNGVLS